MTRENETLEYFEHITIDGDRWDLLAYDYYNDAKKMNIIIKANPEVLLKPVIAAGVKLRIPVIKIENPVSGGLPPWKLLNQ